MSIDETTKMAIMDRWLGEVCAELGVHQSVLEANTAVLLGLIKEVAHGPSRPGAPMTAFLIGLAAGAASNDAAAQAAAVTDRVAAVSVLVEQWNVTAAGTPVDG